MPKYCLEIVLNKGETFESHKHLLLCETYIEAESLEEAQRLVKEDLHISVYASVRRHLDTLKSPEDVDKITSRNYR